jgi:hypothetical protein
MICADVSGAAVASRCPASVRNLRVTAVKSLDAILLAVGVSLRTDSCGVVVAFAILRMKLSDNYSPCWGVGGAETYKYQYMLLTRIPLFSQLGTPGQQP